MYATYGNVNATYGNVNATYGNVNAAYGDVNAAYGDVNAAHGDVNAAYGNVNTTYGDVDAADGTVNGAPRLTGAQHGRCGDVPAELDSGVFNLLMEAPTLNRARRSIVIYTALALALLQVGCSATRDAHSQAKDGVFIHIKSGPDHPHSVLMGLRMAQMMSADQDVLVYVDVDGINAVLQGAPDLTMEPFGSSHAMIEDLVARKVPIYACPGCLAALGKKPEQLMPGVMVAEKQAFFSFTQGRILTLDY